MTLQPLSAILASAGLLGLTSLFAFVPVAAPAVGHAPVISGLDPIAGNLTGGSLVTIDVANVLTFEGTRVTIGGQPAPVAEVVPGVSVRVRLPEVIEATGSRVDVTVTTAAGTDIAPAAFTYTPTLKAWVTGDTVTGGKLFLDWLTTPAVENQLVLVWVGNPLLPDLHDELPGYSGLIYEEPDLTFLTMNENSHPIALPYRPLPDFPAGISLNLQGLARGEGSHKGSFTNPVTISIP